MRDRQVRDRQVKEKKRHGEKDGGGDGNRKRETGVCWRMSRLKKEREVREME